MFGRRLSQSFVLGALALACAQSTHTGETVDLLTLVDRLIAARPLTAAKVEALTGVRLVPNTASHNPFYVLSVSSSPRGIFRQVELREPRQGATRSGGILILDLDPAAAGIDHTRIPERYGKDFAFEPPAGHGPPNAPAYYSYQRPWGDLRFGFSRSNGRVEVVVIDAAE